jgi:hypothetical protein
MICSPRLLGFLLDQKQWVQLWVKSVQNDEIKADTTPYQNLVLSDDGDEEKNLKDLVCKLVDQHSANAPTEQGEAKGKFQDFIHGKGQGLVMLLHGKSLTRSIKQFC